MPCASGDKCILKADASDTHKCPICKKNVHAICGDPNPDDDGSITYSTICYICIESQNKKEAIEEEDESDTVVRTTRSSSRAEEESKKRTRSEGSRASVSVINKKLKTKNDLTWDGISEAERKEVGDSWYMTNNDDVFSLFPDVPKHKGAGIDLTNELINVPAIHWGIEGNWWKSSIYEKSLQDLGAEELKRAVLVGKVAFRLGNKYVIALFANPEHDELSDMAPRDVRRFLRDPSLIGMNDKVETADADDSDEHSAILVEAEVVSL